MLVTTAAGKWLATPGRTRRCGLRLIGRPTVSADASGRAADARSPRPIGAVRTSARNTPGMYSASDLKTVSLDELRPTQISLGLDAVATKRRKWSALAGDERRAAIEDIFPPAVRGPSGKYFLLDGHHTALALIQEKVDRVRVGIAEDLSRLGEEDFWVFLDHRSWLHCYDAEGRRRPFDAIPQRFEDMQDDVYRTLASRLQAAGGFAKVGTPFEEFLWANFLRRAVDRELLESEPEKALEEALRAAYSRSASYLPGWCGRLV
ncbi:ParB-like protein [Piscinibacter koreensis]|uniref:Chromosome partitioning protein ParB n=1 Tax=Piscinibacter koreensis TaxID=2742824 RepID=A0A7Y6NP26_9BURK|nr:ParB-like protein [Schlegelella koreensis]NUZ06569.1 chromosome partitioning protein ParB [Schlegelella koreensis]